MMKVAWRWSQQPGGSSNIGSGAEANAIDVVSAAPPSTYPSVNMTSPKTSAALATAGSLNGISCETHWSYVSTPAVRSMMSSIQSVAGHPVAPADSKPTHQGVPPSATIWSLSASISSHVVGTWYPAASKSSFGYHTMLFKFTFVGMP